MLWWRVAIYKPSQRCWCYMMATLTQMRRDSQKVMSWGLDCRVRLGCRPETEKAERTHTTEMLSSDPPRKSASSVRSVDWVGGLMKFTSRSLNFDARGFKSSDDSACSSKEAVCLVGWVGDYEPSHSGVFLRKTDQGWFNWIMREQRL